MRKENTVSIRCRWFLAVILCIGTFLTPSLTLAGQTLFVSALTEGTLFTANSSGTYRFTINSGAIEVAPRTSQPDHPELWGWQTRLLIFKNAPVQWFGNPYANPINWTFEVGDGSLQPTYQQAEQIGAGKFVDIQLTRDDYLIIVANDSTGYFWDNSGGVTLSVDIRKGSAVPTLSQWGMIVLFLVLVGSGFGAIRRRRA